jgi:PAS domain S-box-containing protein
LQYVDRDASCYSIPLVVKFAKERGISEKQLFNGIEAYKDLVMNPLEWTDARVVVRFMDNFRIALGNSDDLLVEAAADIIRNQVSFFQLFFIKIAPLSLISKKLSKHAASGISKNKTMSFELPSPGKAILSIRPHATKDKYSASICSFNMGCAIGAADLKGIKNLKVKELSCAARTNAKECVYEFTWDRRPIIETLKSWFFLHFGSQTQILSHMESAHQQLQTQHKELKSVQEFYAHVMANMDEAVAWCDQEGIITFANPGFSHLTGLDERVIAGKHIFEITRPTSKKKSKLFEQCIAAPMAPQSVELELSLSNNSKKLGEASFTYVVSQERNPGFLVVIRDVTEAREIERQLRLETSRVAQLDLQRTALEKDLEVTGMIQTLLLPKTKVFNNCHYRLACSYRPATQSGGDWYWYEEKKDGSIRVLLGDVTGHGAGAAMVVSAVAGAHQCLQSACLGGNTWMTMGILDFDPIKGEIRYTSAGAPKIFLRNRNGECSVLGDVSGPLGEAVFRISEHSHPFLSGDRVLAFTDGAYEIQPKNSTRFGPKGLMKLFMALPRGDTEWDVAKLEEDISSATALGSTENDDRTMILIDYK